MQKRPFWNWDVSSSELAEVKGANEVEVKGKTSCAHSQSPGWVSGTENAESEDKEVADLGADA